MDQQQFQEIMLSQMKELTEVVKAIRDRQDETDAKLEALSIAVYRTEGRVSSLESRFDVLESRFDVLESKVDAIAAELKEFKEETNLSFLRWERNIRSQERDLDLTITRVDRLENNQQL